MNSGTKRTERKSSMAAIALCLLLGGATVSTAAPSPNGAGANSHGSEPHSKVVIVIRHAEKATGEPNDPPLTEQGVRRAEALAKLLAAAGVTHLYASPYRRTRDTLAPLAARLGKEVREIAALEPERQVAAIMGLPAGSVAVVAGHSNTVPRLVSMLGGEVSGLIDSPAGPVIDERSHDRLFLLTLPAAGAAKAARATTLELRYGE